MQWDELFLYENGNLLNKKTKHIYRNKDRDGYIRIRVLGREYRAHRIIWEMFNGPIPAGMLIDHINRDTSNNKIENLRLATPTQNVGNSAIGVKNRVLPRGVTLNPSGKYRARITISGKTYSLGTFNTMEEAERAVISKDLEIRKEYSAFTQIAPTNGLRP